MDNSAMKFFTGKWMLSTYKPETNAFLIRLCLIKYFSVNVIQLFSTQRLGTFFVYDSLVIRFLVHI